MANTKPRILVGCPTADYKNYCLDKYIEGLKNLSYGSFDVLIVDNSKTDDYYNELKKTGFKVIKDKWVEWARDRIVSSRNIMRDEFLKGKYDYMLMLEQDVVPPMNIIENLIKHKKDIVSGVYYTYVFMMNDRKKKIIPHVFKISSVSDEKKGKTYALRAMVKEASGNELLEVDATGLGCCLISRKVMENIKFRYKKNTQDFDDLPFCFDSKKAGFQVYADMSMKCMHYIEGWDWNNSSCKMKHPDYIRGFDGNIDDLVRAIGVTRYDTAAEVFGKLGDEYKKQADGDKARGRPQLAGRLYEISEKFYDARDKMQEIWKLCEPYMKE